MMPKIRVRGCEEHKSHVGTSFPSVPLNNSFLNQHPRDVGHRDQWSELCTRKTRVWAAGKTPCQEQTHIRVWGRGPSTSNQLSVAVDLEGFNVFYEVSFMLRVSAAGESREIWVQLLDRLSTATGAINFSILYIKMYSICIYSSSRLGSWPCRGEEQNQAVCAVSFVAVLRLITLQDSTSMQLSGFNHCFFLFYHWFKNFLSIQLNPSACSAMNRRILTDWERFLVSSGRDTQLSGASSWNDTATKKLPRFLSFFFFFEIWKKKNRRNLQISW